jgi:hypothetical protein
MFVIACDESHRWLGIAREHASIVKGSNVEGRKTAT